MVYIDHHFRVDIAEKYGVDIAVFLHDVFYWVHHNWANQKHFYDGRYWTYNTMAAFCEVHPYWSRRQIERIIATCKAEDLLLVGCFNKDSRDRTSWYTLSDKALAYFCDDIRQAPDTPAPPENTPENPPEEPPSDTPELAECISPNGEMEITERGNASHQTVTALPYNIPSVNKPSVNTPHTPQGGNGGAKASKYDLQEDAKPVLRRYCGDDMELAQALADLIAVRRELKAINSKRGITALLSELDRLSGGHRETKLLLLRQSIANSWKSVFPLKGSGQTPTVSQKVQEEEGAYAL